MSNEEEDKAYEAIFKAYMEQTQFLQLMYLESWEKLQTIAHLQRNHNSIELFNKAIEQEMEFLAQLIILDK
jgi:intergrase/recombinase